MCVCSLSVVRFASRQRTAHGATHNAQRETHNLDPLSRRFRARRARALLARRPGHRPPSKQVDVQMIHALPPIPTGVDHGPVPGLGDALLPSNGSSKGDHSAEQVGIVRVVERGQMLFGDDQNVNRCLRIQIPERDDVLAVHDHFRGNFATRDSAEDAAPRFSHAIVSSVPAMRPRSQQPRPPRSQNVACSLPASQAETPRR